ncbi:hypothetical protein ABLN87_07160 [Ruegeria sp. SCPT10]|uniref:hypothetical protein n=1 Tax=Ruegeria sp. SCP10 TaxID=3141377 RepID=UPI00333C8A24
MNNLELLASFQAEEHALSQAFSNHDLNRESSYLGLSAEFSDLFRDVLKFPDDELCEKLREHIASGADVDATPRGYGVTPFGRCFADGKMASMRLLIRSGAKTGWTPDQVSLALGDVPASPQTKDLDPFWFACRVGNIAAAREYVSKFNAGRNKDSGAVIAAVRARASDVVKWLMDLGFDPNAIDDIEWGALERAVDNDDLATAEALLAAGAAPFGSPAKSYTSPVANATSDPMRRLFVAYGVNPAEFEYGPSLEDPELSSLPEIKLTQSVFEANRTRRVGQSNPERLLPAFWSEQMRIGGYGAPKSLICAPDRNNPVWTFSRFGRSATVLPDGRLVFVAGEHEDHYDDDFCIYADVTVLGTDGSVDHFVYPEDVFPPTDFHSATLVGDQIWLIGSLGYPENRRKGQTQVLRLNTINFSITPMQTSGSGPGWIHRHRAVLTEGGILVIGGKIEPGYEDNDSTFLLNLETLNWSEVSNSGHL